MSDEPAASISNISGGINITGDADVRGEVGDRFGESSILFNIGWALDEMGRTAEAVDDLEQCVTRERFPGWFTISRWPVIPARFWRESRGPISTERQCEAWMPDRSTRA